MPGDLEKSLLIKAVRYSDPDLQMPPKGQLTAASPLAQARRLQAPLLLAMGEADRRGWAFEQIEGSMVLLRRLLRGDWNEDMLILQPGERLAMSYDDGIVKAVPGEG